MSTVRMIAIVCAVACLAACGGSPPVSSAAAPAQQATPSSAPVADTADVNGMPAGLPPLPTVPFPAALPMPVVRAVYTFAAEHPEVLRKVPCFCGCESRGHRHNDDCFVAGRDAAGRVTAWEPHGLG
jgi:hypothetical protein